MKKLLGALIFIAGIFLFFMVTPDSSITRAIACFCIGLGGGLLLKHNG